jgi:hypothetical protein
MSSSNEGPNATAGLTSPNNTSPHIGAPSSRGSSSKTPSGSENAGISPSSFHPQSSQPNQTDQKHNSQLNPRSCVTCRRRKVRCNKREPCSNCVKAGIECVFPGPGRAPRKPRRAPDTELLSRLRRLEGVVDSLGGAAAIERLTLANSSSTPPSTNVHDNDKSQASAPNDDICSYLDSDPRKAPVRKGTQEELGRLVVEEGRSRYVSNRFWASLGDQVSKIAKIRIRNRSCIDCHRSKNCRTFSTPRHRTRTITHHLATQSTLAIRATMHSSLAINLSHTVSGTIIQPLRSYSFYGRLTSRM